MELEHLPSEYTLLAAFHAITADFLDGQKTAAEAVYCQGWLLELWRLQTTLVHMPRTL